MKTKHTLALRKVATPPKPTGLGVNLIIGDLDGTFKHGQWPSGIAAAIITNDLRAAVAAAYEFTTWEDVQEAVRFVYTHIEMGKIEAWRKKLRKGGAR